MTQAIRRSRGVATFVAAATLGWVCMLQAAAGAEPSRTAATSAPRLPATVQFTFRVLGAGRLDVQIGTESFSCEGVCTRAIRGGTPLQMTAVATNSFYRLDAWKTCRGAMSGNSCRMAVPTNTIAAGIDVVFVFPQLEQSQQAWESFCAGAGRLCERCSGARAASDPACYQFPSEALRYLYASPR